MAQTSKQIQEQKLEQRQTLSQQQLLLVRLLELPAEALEERIRAEVLENPALEETDDRESREVERYENSPLDEEDETENDADNSYNEELAYAAGTDSDNPALGDYRTEDDIPDYQLREDNAGRSCRAEEIPFSDTVSFYEILKEQLGECELTIQEEEIGEYLIGSLDDDGLLRKTLETIADELLIYHGIETNGEELLRILKMIQGFDPAGIGARNLQECLLLQLKRKPNSDINSRAEQILERCYEDFTYKRWDRIMQRLDLKEEEFKEALEELIHLNPRPGSALGETMDKNTQPIIPDFIVEIDDNERITFELNNHHLPELTINAGFNRMMQEYAQNKQPNKEQKEAMFFLKQKVDSARNFIQAIEQRQHTLTITMQAIIRIQQAFFLEGDEQLLVPMKLKDVAEEAGVDISTVSRVSNSKYVQTEFGIFPLKFFFGDSYRKPVMLQNRHSDTPKANEEENNEAEDINEEKSIRLVRATIQECIDNEDKQSPLTDEELRNILKEKGFNLARRTIAKYRQQLGIPVARMRR